MFKRAKLLVRNATDADQNNLANLIHFGVHVHRHLDWKEPLEWLGSKPFLVIEDKGKLIAALACPPDPPQVAWIRVLAVSSNEALENIWNIVWYESAARLGKQNQIEWAAAIPLQRWFQLLLHESNFTVVNQVLMLRWNVCSPTWEKPSSSIMIRPMNENDLAMVAKIDAAAFIPLWQNSQTLLEIAFRRAAIATIAEFDGKTVGYQISTGTIDGGHLARLAVNPVAQKNGVGTALLRDIMIQFKRRGARSLTVNTQSDNLPSLSLYQKAGFQLTGEKYAVFGFLIHS